MTSEKIFSITGKEITKEKSCTKIDDATAERSDIAKISYIHGLHVFTILFGCGLAMSILTLIPRHNPIHEPDYWYEIIFPREFGVIIVTTSMILDMSILMERETKISTFSYFQVIIASCLAWIAPYCIGYILWTMILDFNYPMPWFAILCVLFSSIVGMVIMPRVFSSGVFDKKEFKRKSNYFVGYQLLWFFVMIVKNVLSAIFQQTANTDAQCVIAFLIPIVKRCSLLAYSKVMKQIIGTENERANVLLTITMNVTYGLFAAIFLTRARSTTMICMVVVEFLIQLNMTYCVVKLHRKVTVLEAEQDRIDKRKAILKLLLAELSEGMVPLGYAIGFAMAFYGPNGNLIGNVRNEYWQYTAVDDASWTFLVMAGLFALDLICLLLNSTIVWIFSQVNLFEEFCNAMKKYWHIMALKMIGNIYKHFLYLDVNNGYDRTLNFDWITSNRTFATFADPKIFENQ